MTADAIPPTRHAPPPAVVVTADAIPPTRHAPPPEVRLPMQRRDEILRAFADVLDAENAAAARHGLIGRFRSPHDPFAIVGAVCELVSRQVRLGVPADVLDLASVIDRLILGLIPADE